VDAVACRLAGPRIAASSETSASAQPIEKRTGPCELVRAKGDKRLRRGADFRVPKHVVFVLTHGLEIVDRIRKREIFKIVSATVTVGAPISRAASENLLLSLLTHSPAIDRNGDPCGLSP